MEQTILLSSFANPEPVQIETGSAGKLVEQVRTLATCAGQTVTPSPRYTFEAKPDRLTAFLELLAAVKSELPGTAGCEDIRILRKVDEPTSISLIETWGSRVESTCRGHRGDRRMGSCYVPPREPAGESLFSGGLAPSCDGGREMNCRTFRSHHRDSRSSPIMHVAQ